MPFAISIGDRGTISSFRTVAKALVAESKRLCAAFWALRRWTSCEEATSGT